MVSSAKWRQSTWGDEISLEYGKSLRDYTQNRGPVRVYGSNGPIGYHNVALSDGPGVILGRKGAYRGVEYSDGPFFVIDTAYYVVPKTKLDMRWLYYAIKHHKLGEIDDGSPIPSTTRSAVYVRELDVPDITEQKNIAKALEIFDKKIELNQRMNETLEAMAQAIFKSWFVDFDPVKSKAEGRTPEGMDATTAALFPSTLTDDSIPEGWDTGILGDLIKPQKGKNITKKTITEGHIPVVAGGLEPAYYHNTANAAAPVVTISASGANAGFVRLYHEDIWASDCSFINSQHSQFVYTFYTLLKIRQIEIYGMQQGAAQPHIYPSDLMRLKIVIPSSDVWKEIEKILTPLYEKVGLRQRENCKLSQLRDALLPRLISGKLSITEEVA